MVPFPLGACLCRQAEWFIFMLPALMIHSVQQFERRRRKGGLTNMQHMLILCLSLDWFPVPCPLPSSCEQTVYKPA